MLFEDYQQKLYPNEVKESQYLDYFTHEVNMLNPQTDVIYVGFKILTSSKNIGMGKR